MQYAHVQMGTIDPVLYNSLELQSKDPFNAFPSTFKSCVNKITNRN